MKEGRCSCDVLWLLLLISVYFMEFVIRLLVFADLVSFFFFVKFFQLPQSLHSCKLSPPWLVHSASIIETPQTTKSGRPGISANWSNALWKGGGGVELRASWFDYLENATRGVIFFFLILEPKNNGGIVVYLHLPFLTKRAVWDGNVYQVYFPTCLFHAWPPISSANWIDYLQYISRFICSFHHLHITLIHSCKTVVFLREILQNNWLTQL